MNEARRRAELLLLFFVASASMGGAQADTLLYAAEGNRLRVLEIGPDGRSTRDTVLIERASLAPETGRDVNGMICLLPDGSGRFIAGEDTGQPEIPGGWGVFSPDGRQLGKLTATSFASEYPEPFGCAFAADGRLFTTEIGDPGYSHGQLILWFPPAGGFGSGETAQYCKLAVDLATPGAVVIDAKGRVYVATSSGLEILRFRPPFPSGPTADAGCGAQDATGAPLATGVTREVFTGAQWSSALLTYSGLALSGRDTLYAASVVTGRIGEFDLEGNLLRLILTPSRWWPPFATGTPQGLAVDASGALYYADLDLTWSGGLDVGPGPDGKLWRIEMDPEGRPGIPQVLMRGLAFPDAVTIVDGTFDSLPPSRRRASPESASEH